MAACEVAEKPRVMKQCYGGLDKLITGLRARRAAIPDSQIACAEAITREIADYQNMKKEIAHAPSSNVCRYQLNSELAALEARKAKVPTNIAACVKDSNGDLLKAQSQLTMLNLLDKFQSDVPTDIEFCKTMRSKLNGLRKLEYNLMMARSSIIAGLDPALRDKSKQDKHMDENFKTGVAMADDAKKDETKAALEAAMRNDKDYLPKRQAYMKYCIDTLSPRLFGISWMPKVKLNVLFAGGAYLGGDELFSKEGQQHRREVHESLARWRYHKQGSSPTPGSASSRSLKPPTWPSRRRIISKPTRT